MRLGCTNTGALRAKDYRNYLTNASHSAGRCVDRSNWPVIMPNLTASEKPTEDASLGTANWPLTIWSKLTIDIHHL